MTETRFPAGKTSDFAEDSITAVELGGQELVIIRQGGEFFALPDRCTHERYPLHDGELLDGKVKCIKHGATFDLRSGRATMPAIKKIRIFDTLVEGDELFVLMQEA